MSVPNNSEVMVFDAGITRDELGRGYVPMAFKRYSC